MVLMEWREEEHTRERRWDFKVRDGEWEIGGFTSNMDAEDFDIDKENQLVLKCNEKILEIFKNPNKFEKRLARMLDIPLEDPKTRKLYNDVFFINNERYFCWGSGGIGGGKVYWTPYTSRNKWREKERDTMVGCDNCRVLAHEDLHSIGSHAEFDELSELIAIYFRLENLPEDMWGKDVKRSIEWWATETWRYANGKRTRTTRKSRDAFCSVYTRYPEKTMKILREKGFNDNDIKMATDTCK